MYWFFDHSSEAAGYRFLICAIVMYCFAGVSFCAILLSDMNAKIGSRQVVDSMTVGAEEEEKTVP
jgi:hypothetical protein